MNPRILVLAHNPALAALLLTGAAQQQHESVIVVTEPGPEPPPVPAMQEREEVARLADGMQWPAEAIQRIALTCPRIDDMPPPVPFDPPRSHGKAAQRRRAKGW